MLKFIVVLTLVAACTAQLTSVAVTSLVNGEVQFEVTGAAADQAIIIGTQLPSAATSAAYLVCKVASSNLGTAAVASCGSFLCTSRTTGCVQAVDNSGITSVSKSNANVYTFTRSRTLFATDDVLVENGSVVFFTAITSDLTATVFNPATLNAALSGTTAVALTATITPFSGVPAFKQTLVEDGENFIISLSTAENTLSGLGFIEGTNTFPSWAYLCLLKAAAGCVEITCTSESACAAPTTSRIIGTPVVDLTNRTANAKVSRTVATGLVLQVGSQNGARWIERVDAAAVAITIAEGQRASWSTFTTVPLMGSFTGGAGPDFGFTLSMPTSTTVAMSYLTNDSKYAGVGFQKENTLYPSYVVLCEPVTQTECMDYTCTNASTCAAVTITGTESTGRDATARTIMFTRPLVATQSILTTGVKNMLWTEGAAATTFSYDVTQIQAIPWKAFSRTLVFEGQRPSFGASIADAGTTQKIVTLTTTAGTYLGFGATAIPLTSGGFPTTVTACEPVSLAECGVYSCSTAAICEAYTGATQTRDAATRTATITFPNAAFPSNPTSGLVSENLVDAAFQASASTTLNTFWFEKPIPTGGVTLAPSLVTSQTWMPWLAGAAAPITAPDFPITFTVPSPSVLGVSMTPGTDQTVMLGWRASLLSTTPLDVAICAPSSSVDTCLDVVCTSTTSCATRTPTILTENTSTGTSASFKRGFTAGQVDLSSTNAMWLAYTRAATPTSTTVLNASMAQGATWSFYTAPAPSGSTSNFYATVPSILAGILAITYIL